MPPAQSQPPATPTSHLKQAFGEERIPQFTASGLEGTIENKYVAWVDLLGARNIMGRSVAQAAQHIACIHASALKHSQAVVVAYPVIDGCYILSTDRLPLEAVLRNVMKDLAARFVHERKPENKSLVRGGIAAGRVIQGAILAGCSKTLSDHDRYARCIAIGSAIGQAYSAESHAPPFGFWVDITARSFLALDDQPFMQTYWRWWDDGSISEDVARAFGGAVMEYYEWASTNRRAIEYPKDRLFEHAAAAAEYFRVDLPKGWPQ